MAADGTDYASMQATDRSITTEMQIRGDLQRVLSPYPKPPDRIIDFHKRNALSGGWEALSLDFRHQVSGYHMPSLLPSGETKAVLVLFTGCEGTALMSTVPIRSMQKRGMAVLNLTLVHNDACRDPHEQIAASVELNERMISDPDFPLLSLYGDKRPPVAIAGQSAGALTSLTNLLDTNFAQRVQYFGNSVHFIVPFLGANGISRGYPVSEGLRGTFENIMREGTNLAFDVYAHQNPHAVLGTSRIDRIVTPEPSRILCATRIEGHTLNAYGNEIVADIEDLYGSNHPIFGLNTTAHIALDDEASCPRTAVYAGGLLGWQVNPITGGHQQLSNSLRAVEQDVARDFGL